jgi:hypothetical protein
VIDPGGATAAPWIASVENRSGLSFSA